MCNNCQEDVFGEAPTTPHYKKESISSKLPRLSSKLPRLSGKDVVKVLCNHFNFKVFNSKGSHLTLKNDTVRPPVLLEVIMHSELKQGTLQEIVTNSGVGREAFLQAINS